MGLADARHLVPEPSDLDFITKPKGWTSMDLRRFLLLPILVALIPARVAMPGDRSEAPEIKGWGRAIDPDGDCKFAVEDGRVTIGIPGKVHALSAERGQTNAPRILRDVNGDFIAQVKVSGVSTPRSDSLVPERRPFQAAGLLLWLDDGTYIRLERAGMILDDRGVTYANFELRSDRRFERIGDASEHPLGGEETYLRLERRGVKLLASVSPDGKQWTPLRPILVELPDRVRVGVAATHNTSSPFEPRFEGFKVYQR
jgi:regulation of enolase protein 1 (concanavalin A-like superfamily)